MFIGLLNGISQSIISLKHLPLLIKNSFNCYFKIMFINFLLLIFPKLVLNLNNKIILFIYKIYIIPSFIFCYFYTIDKFGDLLKFLENRHKLKESNSNIIDVIYFNITSLIYFCITNIIIIIPYLGFYLALFFLYMISDIIYLNIRVIIRNIHN